MVKNVNIIRLQCFNVQAYTTGIIVIVLAGCNLYAAKVINLFNSILKNNVFITEWSVMT